MKHQIFVILLCLPFFVLAQNAVIHGTVTDAETGRPLPSSHIVLEHTLLGTTTNLDGEFHLDLSNQIETNELIIIISRIGYNHIRKVIDNPSEDLNIQLVSKSLQLSEVIVSTHKSNFSDKKNSTIPVFISKTDIKQSSVQNIPEILRKQTGISLAGQSYHASPSIRGLARKRVVVLLDGDKVSSERNVGPPGTFINPSEIERIEILKGPYATLYGSDAVGGVVNIISKSYEKPFYSDKIGGKLDLSYRTVSNGKNANLAIDGKLSRFKYHLHSGYRISDNYKVPDGKNLMNTFAEEKHIGGHLVYDINPSNQLIVSSLYSKGGPIGKPAYDTLTNAIHDYDDHKIIKLNYKIQNISHVLSKIEISTTQHEHDLGVKIIKHKQEINPAEDKLVNNRKVLEGKDYSTKMDVYLTLNTRFKIVTGFDGYFRKNINISEEKVVRNFNTGIFIKQEQTTLMSDGAQDSYGLFAQADYILKDNFFLNAGVRWDYFKTSNPLINNFKTRTAWSGNIGLSYNISQYFNIKTNIGTAYRVPDIKELYVTTNTPGGLNISNPNLVSERSFNTDIAFVYRTQKSLYQLGVFRNSIIDMIVLDWNNTSANRNGTFKNIGWGLLYGLELSINQSVNHKINVFVNLAKIYGKDVNADDELMDVPPLQINAGTNYRINDKISLSLSGRFSGQQKDVAEDDVPNNAFLVFDFSGRWKVLKNLNVNFSVSNILNQKYREHYQFDWMYAQTRSFNAGLNFIF